VGSVKGAKTHTARLLSDAKTIFSSGPDGERPAWVAIDKSRTALTRMGSWEMEGTQGWFLGSALSPSGTIARYRDPARWPREQNSSSGSRRSNKQLQSQISLQASIVACASEHAFARRRVKWLRCRHFTQSKLNLSTPGSFGRCDTETHVSPLITSLWFLQHWRAVISRGRKVWARTGLEGPTQTASRSSTPKWSLHPPFALGDV
jgi:hypothetical protein